MNADRWRWLPWLPPTLYLLSLAMPVTGPVLKSGSDGYHFGYEAFQVGFRVMTLDEDVWDLERIEFSLAWLANPAMWMSFACLAIGRRRGAIVASSSGSLLSMCILPIYASAVLCLPGYWLWWGSAGATLLIAMFMLPRNPLQQADDYQVLTSPLTPDP
ncbi:MAG TPA: hypothetical protein VHR66_18625 [Gemmataceae bacterium]|jgi:hypothetical protein|nr:hypothetical protein [Gemmataceae bacterium]